MSAIDKISKDGWVKLLNQMVQLLDERIQKVEINLMVTRERIRNATEKDQASADPPPCVAGNRELAILDIRKTRIATQLSGLKLERAAITEVIDHVKLGDLQTVVAKMSCQSGPLRQVAKDILAPEIEVWSPKA